MKLLFLSILCRSSLAFKFNKKLALAALIPMIPRMGVSSDTSPPEPPRKVDYQDKGSRHFNHRGDWGRIAELTNAIYSDPKNMSNWKERARLYKESDLPFNAFSDLTMSGVWSTEEANWQHNMLWSSVECAIGHPVQAMRTLALGFAEFKNLSSAIPVGVISFFKTFFQTENFEDLPESCLLDLKNLSTLDLSIFDKYDGETDFKNWLMALKTTALILVELKEEIASLKTRSIKIVSARKALSSEMTADLINMRMSVRKSRSRTEFRSGPGGDRSPERLLPFLKSPDPNRPMVKMIAVQPHPRGGYGIFALENIPAEELVLVENPMFSFNDDHTGKELCHHCHRKITTVCACQRCQEVYCSDDCRKYASMTYHTPICGTNYKAMEAMVMKSSKTSLARGWCTMIKMIGAAAMLPRKSPERPNTPLDIPGLAVLSRCTDVEALSESMVTEFEDESIGNVMSTTVKMLNHLGAIALDNPALDLVTIKTLYDILRANGFHVGSGSKDSNRASGIFLWASFFNHDCEPNTYYLDTSIMSDKFSPAGKIFCTNKAVAKGEELTIAYADMAHLDPLYKQQILRGTYGFECRCNLCRKVDHQSLPSSL